MGDIATGLAPIIQHLETKYGPRANWPSPTDSDVPKPYCPSCGDQGFVYRTRDIASPDFGKAFPCTACDGSETADDRTDRLWRISGIGNREKALCTFSAFDIAVNPDMRPAFMAAQKWGVGDGPPFLVLCGLVGRGKTHLALAAASACITRGEAVAYHIVPNFLQALRDTMRPARDDEPPPRSLSEVRRRAERYPAVILDDLGANKATDWADEQLYSVVNERWREARRTIITSNVPAARLEERLRSRILDTALSTVVECAGVDYRGIPK